MMRANLLFLLGLSACFVQSNLKYESDLEPESRWQERCQVESFGDSDEGLSFSAEDAVSAATSEFLVHYDWGTEVTPKVGSLKATMKVVVTQTGDGENFLPTTDACRMEHLLQIPVNIRYTVVDEEDGYTIDVQGPGTLYAYGLEPADLRLRTDEGIDLEEFPASWQPVIDSLGVNMSLPRFWGYQSPAEEHLAQPVPMFAVAVGGETFSGKGVFTQVLFWADPLQK